MNYRLGNRKKLKPLNLINQENLIQKQVVFFIKKAEILIYFPLSQYDKININKIPNSEANKIIKIDYSNVNNNNVNNLKTNGT